MKREYLHRSKKSSEAHRSIAFTCINGWFWEKSRTVTTSRLQVLSEQQLARAVCMTNHLTANDDWRSLEVFSLSWRTGLDSTSSILHMQCSILGNDGNDFWPPSKLYVLLSLLPANNFVLNLTFDNVLFFKVYKNSHHSFSSEQRISSLCAMCHCPVDGSV